MQVSRKFIFKAVLVLFLQLNAVCCWALSSSNIPLDSAVYLYLEKLEGLGLIKSDVKGIRPFSKAEAARLVLEAEENVVTSANSQRLLADQLIVRLRELIPREISLRNSSDKKPPFFDYNLISSFRLRYVYLDGSPRSFERPVHDPGDDGVFGIGSGLRPKNPYPFPVQQRGSEGTPLLENNSGIIYRNGNNGELRWGAEAYLSDKVSGLIEPSILVSEGDTRAHLNRGYFKLGGGGCEFELGKDENWLGQGFRGNITLTNNAENLTEIKLSSPEPLKFRWFSWLGDIKYAFIFSRLDKIDVSGVERQPWFYALKLVSKPRDNVEIGFNLGRQQGGPGVNNSVGDNIRGLLGGTGADNSNSLAGFELRYRMPWLRNTEVFGEFSGEDTAAFWPIVESYLAGFYIPCLTSDGRNDFRFEFFQGNQILYTSGTFPEGYTYKSLPLGHSQGGATQDFFVRYSHWFSVRNYLAIEYMFTQRGNIGRVTVDSSGKFDQNGTPQAVEQKNSGRIHWQLPIYGDMDLKVTYGYERIRNFDLVAGANRQNQLFVFTTTYRY